MVSESQRQATARYRAANYDNIQFYARKGLREFYRKSADKLNMSLSMLIQTATNEYIDKHLPPE